MVVVIVMVVMVVIVFVVGFGYGYVCGYGGFLLRSVVNSTVYRQRQRTELEEAMALSVQLSRESTLARIRSTLPEEPKIDGPVRLFSDL